MKINIVKISPLIVCTLLLALILYSCDHFHISNGEAEKIINNEFMDNYNYFTDIANDLLNDNDATYKTPYMETLNDLGYDIIKKKNGGIYFYRFRQPFLGRGVMYYPAGFQSDYNPLIVSYKSIKDEEWYFFVEE